MLVRKPRFDFKSWKANYFRYNAPVVMKDGGFLSIPNLILIVFALENISDLKKINELFMYSHLFYVTVSAK